MNRSRGVESLVAGGLFLGFGGCVGAEGRALFVLVSLGVLYGILRWRFETLILQSAVVKKGGRGIMGFLMGAGLAPLAFLPGAPPLLPSFAVGLAGMIWEGWVLSRERKEMSPFKKRFEPQKSPVFSPRVHPRNALFQGGRP